MSQTARAALGSRLLHLTRFAEIVAFRVNGGLDFVANRNRSPLTLAPCSRTRAGWDGCALLRTSRLRRLSRYTSNTEQLQRGEHYRGLITEWLLGRNSSSI